MNIQIEEYEVIAEIAIGLFYRKSEISDDQFFDACQILVDTGIWLRNDIIGETCLFLIQAGKILLPRMDQYLQDGSILIGKKLYIN